MSMKDCNIGRLGGQRSERRLIIIGSCSSINNVFEMIVSLYLFINDISIAALNIITHNIK